MDIWVASIFARCEQCCHEHLFPNICVHVWFHFSGINLAEELLGHMVTLFSPLEELPDRFPDQLHCFPFVICDVENLSMCLLAICMSSGRTVYSEVLLLLSKSALFFIKL